MKVIKAESYGICEGVSLALSKLNELIKKEKDIYLLGNLVHNEILMDSYKKQGVNILKDGSIKDRIDQVKKGTIVFSAHGHDKKLDEYILNKGLKILDTTCPRVKYASDKIISDLKNNKDVIYIGIKNHPEAEAILSLSPSIIFIDIKNPIIPKIRLISPHIYNQTTLSILELEKLHNTLKNTFEDCVIENDICFATTNRQKAIFNINKDIKYVLVIGDKSSSNTMRLYETCLSLYKEKEIYFASSIEDVKKLSLNKKESIFVTAGASTPNQIIDPIIEYLEKL